MPTRSFVTKHRCKARNIASLQQQGKLTVYQEACYYRGPKPTSVTKLKEEFMYIKNTDVLMIYHQLIPVSTLTRRDHRRTCLNRRKTKQGAFLQPHLFKELYRFEKNNTRRNCIFREPSSIAGIDVHVATFHSLMCVLPFTEVKQ